jgi:hypothetical protein
MLNRFLDLVLCGSSFSCSGALCTRWQHGSRRMAHDRTPHEPQPPIPRIVRYSLCRCDDVSALYDASLHPLSYEPTTARLPYDLVLRESLCTQRDNDDDDDDDDSTNLDVDRRFFHEVHCTPLTRQRSQRYHSQYQDDDGDGSSYSTTHIMSSWKTNSTDATRQTKNTMRPLHIPSGTQV